MMMKTALFALLAVVAVDASTKVAVLEVGKTGTVRRTSSVDPETTVNGVTSFWSALHSSTSISKSQWQHAGLTVVPDLFRKPESGVVIGISGEGLNLDSLPVTSSIVGEAPVMEVEGCRCHALLSSIAEWEEVSAEDLSSSVLLHGAKKGLTGVKTVVDSSSALAVDKQLNGIMAKLNLMAEEKGETIVVHLVIEEDDAISRRRRLSESRNLEDEQGEENENDAAENDEDDQEYNGYYGYGYYNEYGEWVTPFKTMFQIQYFNVVLWTSLGLALALFYTIFLMVHMPLEADTLLFGESAKLVGDE